MQWAAIVLVLAALGGATMAVLRFSLPRAAPWAEESRPFGADAQRAGRAGRSHLSANRRVWALAGSTGSLQGRQGVIQTAPSPYPLPEGEGFVAGR
jgi:hypothetical protein